MGSVTVNYRDGTEQTWTFDDDIEVRSFYADLVAIHRSYCTDLNAIYRLNALVHIPTQSLEEALRERASQSLRARDIHHPLSDLVGLYCDTQEKSMSYGF